MQEQETELVNMRYYRRAELKDVRIKNVEYILKIAAVDCYLNKNANLFLPKDLENWLGFTEGKIRIQDSLGKQRTITMGDTPYSRICDYRATCDYKCVWEPKDPSQVKINPSTYSLVHARSDIDRAKRIIRSMYQKYQRNFFDLGEIQAYITNENGQYVAPEIIHKAVEELISVNRNGNPTLFLSDPYHRKGYLVYRGRHYVWQPIDIENKTIPVKARWEPLTEKPELFPLRSVEVNNLRDELHKNKPVVKENKKEKKLEKDTDSATLIAYVMERVEILRSQWSTMIESQELVNDVLVAMVLDRLERANFHYLILSDLLIQMTDEPQDLWNDELLPAFVRYYQYNWVSAPSQDGKPPVGFFWDGQLYVYHKQDIQALDDSNKNTDRLFNSWNKYIKKLPPITAQSGEDADRSSGRIWRDPEIMSKIFGMMEYFKGKEWIFKIVDIMKEKGTKTVQQTKSKRSESRGKKCENFKLPELRTAVELAELPINSADITSKTSCFIVEFYLRQFDILFKNKKRWFITANEIYLMNPSK